MVESGFYKITSYYIDLIAELGGVYRDNKNRPIYFVVFAIKTTATSIGQFPQAILLIVLHNNLRELMSIALYLKEILDLAIIISVTQIDLQSLK